MPDSTALKSILLLAANPRGTVSLRLQEEEREIKERLRLAGYGKVPISSTGATRPRDIQQAMLDFRPQVVHFTGHGTGQDGLAFEDVTGQLKLIDSDALANLFRLFSERVECVVLNACYSDFQAEAIAQHISYVIGMSQAIGDRAAIEFSVGFYTALGAGESIEFAYNLGCNAIQLEGIPEDLTPVLFIKKKNLLTAVPQSNIDFDSGNTQPSTQDIETSLRDGSHPLQVRKRFPLWVGVGVLVAAFVLFQVQKNYNPNEDTKPIPPEDKSTIFDKISKVSSKEVSPSPAIAPTVDLAGTYTFDLRTETASSWLGQDPEGGCSKTGGVNGNVTIQSNGTMTGGGVGWGSGGWHGVFGGRVELGTEPMKWTGSAGDTEMKGTWQGGQISGDFIQRFISRKKEVECLGKVSGFKKNDGTVK